MVTVGIDEVGRGCWAGPLVAGAVVLGRPIAGLADSKVLTRLQREHLSAQIELEATAIGLGWVQPSEVDELGLTESVRLAMKRALTLITVQFDDIIIDGNINYFPNDSRARAVIKADASEPAVSAASVIAKVARDHWMRTEASRLYPQYYFHKHVGYGTKQHQEMLRLHGACALHRHSFKPVRETIATIQ